MHRVELRRLALELIARGVPRNQVCRELGVGRQSTYRWQSRIEPAVGSIHCFRCDRTEPTSDYLYLLGMYLGDGHIATVGRSAALRIYCDDKYPAIIDEVAGAMAAASGAAVNYRRLVGCTQVQATTTHWRCLFPQYGPGMKHTRPIVLKDWQASLITRDPRPLVRGLLHSDGCRVVNTVHRTLPTGTRTYHYSRYFFSNVSDDIRRIFTDALDGLGIAWRQNLPVSISVARREAVAALDEFVGPKS